MTKTPRTKYIARPIDRRTGQDRIGTEGMLSGEYVSYDNACRYMIDRLGQVGTLYNVYVPPGRVIGQHRCYRPSNIRPDWLGEPVKTNL